MEIVVGIVSDTHGLVRPELIERLRGVDLILHAGDVGKPEVLDELEAIAPVHAVRGNVDQAEWAQRLPQRLTVEVGGLRFLVIHNVHEIGGAASFRESTPEQAGFDVVVCGHSHVPLIERSGGILFVNPGSAGPRRFHLPVSMALARVDGGKIDAELVPLL